MRNYNKEELEQWILVENQTYEEIGRRLGITGTAVKKVAKRLDIELPVRRAVNPSESLNRGRRKEDIVCPNCGKKFTPPSSKSKFCCIKCSGEYVYKQNVSKWKSGELSGTSGYTYSGYVKKYLLDKYNCKCQKCGWGEINPYTKLVPLQVHHIDGDSTNNREENLELLCPNCHSLTDNYGSRNTNAPEGKSVYFGKAKA